MVLSFSQERSNEAGIKVILFLICPLLALLYSFKNINSRSSYITFFCFIVYFGFSMFFDGSVRADGLFIAYDFQLLESETLSDFLEKIRSFFSTSNDLRTKDIYEPTLGFFVSRITSNYHIFFMAAAIVFATFMMKSLRYFTSLDKVDKSFCFFVLLYIFCSPQIYSIAGVRFGTASWIAIYAVFKIYVEGEKRYWPLLFVLPLIHVSFLFFLFIIGTATLTSRFSTMWKALLIISYLFSEFASQFVNTGISLINLPFLETWADNYIGPNSIFAETHEGTGFYWITPIFEAMGRAYFFIVMLLFMHNAKQIQSDERTAKLYRLLLVWFTIANFCMAVPHLGLRYMSINRCFIAYIWLVHFKDRKYNGLLYAFPVIFLLSLKNTFDIYGYSLESTFLLSPFVNFIRYIFDYVPILLMR